MPHSVKAVKYVGIADIRTISKREWAATGVKDQDDTEWSAANGFAIPGDEFVDDAIRYFERDEEFVLEEEKTSA